MYIMNCRFFKYHRNISKGTSPLQASNFTTDICLANFEASRRNVKTKYQNSSSIKFNKFLKTLWQRRQYCTARPKCGTA